MSEHTELPLSTHFVSADGLWVVLSADSEVLVKCNDYSIAAFIVRACNAHEDLLAVREAWMKVESESKPNNPCPNYTLRSAYRKYAAKLTIAALTKARETT